MLKGFGFHPIRNLLQERSLLKPRTITELCEVIEQQRAAISEWQTLAEDREQEKVEFLAIANVNSFVEIADRLRTLNLDLDGVFRFLDDLKITINNAPTRRDKRVVHKLEKYSNAPHIWVSDGSNYCAVCGFKQAHPYHRETGSSKDSERVANNDH